MFYSDSILSRKGPLANIWLAAHMERKLTKQQILTTDIPNSIQQLLAVPINFQKDEKVRKNESNFDKDGNRKVTGLPLMALRLKGQLLLGMVRIYTRKTRYLLEDCTELIAKLRSSQLIKLSKLVKDPSKPVIDGSSSDHEGNEEAYSKETKQRAAKLLGSTANMSKEKRLEDFYAALPTSQTTTSTNNLMAPPSPYRASRNPAMIAEKVRGGGHPSSDHFYPTGQQELDMPLDYDLVNYEELAQEAAIRASKKFKDDQVSVEFGEEFGSLVGGRGFGEDAGSMMETFTELEQEGDQLVASPGDPFEVARRLEPGQLATPLHADPTQAALQYDPTRFTPVKLLGGDDSIQVDHSGLVLSPSADILMSPTDSTLPERTVAFLQNSVDGPSTPREPKSNLDMTTQHMLFDSPRFSTVSTDETVLVSPNEGNEASTHTPTRKRRVKHAPVSNEKSKTNSKLSTDAQIELSGAAIQKQLKDTSDITHKSTNSTLSSSLYVHFTPSVHTLMNTGAMLTEFYNALFDTDVIALDIPNGAKDTSMQISSLDLEEDVELTLPIATSLDREKLTAPLKEQESANQEPPWGDDDWGGAPADMFPDVTDDVPAISTSSNNHTKSTLPIESENVGQETLHHIQNILSRSDTFTLPFKSLLQKIPEGSTRSVVSQTFLDILLATTQGKLIVAQAEPFSDITLSLPNRSSFRTPLVSTSG